jgi:hypothetical protein
VDGWGWGWCWGCGVDGGCWLCLLLFLFLSMLLGWWGREEESDKAEVDARAKVGVLGQRFGRDVGGWNAELEFGDGGEKQTRQHGDCMYGGPRDFAKG